MSQIAKQLFDSLGAMAPGIRNLVQETGAELKRLGVQGAAESAGALFNGSGYVPYGAGQQPSQRGDMASFMTRMEAYADAFGRMATTDEQKHLAENMGKDVDATWRGMTRGNDGEERGGMER